MSPCKKLKKMKKFIEQSIKQHLPSSSSEPAPQSPDSPRQPVVATDIQISDSNQSGDDVLARARSIPGLDLRREEHRLRTLRAWPGRGIVNYKKAAKYGLYYTGIDDLLKCVFCDEGILSWLPHDNPLVAHEIWSADCPLLKGRPVGNVPLINECGPFESRNPSHIVFMTEAARLASFTNWPEHMLQRPDELVDAGFFYTGQDDQTICFWCGGGLRDWQDTDLPWEQHATWFGLCPFLLAIKGESYVNEVKQILPAFESYSLLEPEPDPAPQRNRNDVDSNVCGICYEGVRNICFLPCGHVISCADCATSIDTCPVCRGPINKKQQIYYS